MKSILTELGKQIKISLIDQNQTQEWLITQVKESTGLYFDSSYLYKVMVGKNNNPRILSAIKEILKIA